MKSPGLDLVPSTSAGEMSARGAGESRSPVPACANPYLCANCGANIAGGGFRAYFDEDDFAVVCSCACASGVATRRVRRGGAEGKQRRLAGLLGGWR
jgi:hypothetical protein